MQDIVFGNCASHRDPGERRQQGQAFEIVIDTLPPGVCLLHELGNRGGSCDVATQFRHVGKECLIGLLLLVDHRIDPPGHNAQDQRSAGGDVLLRQPGLCRGKPLSAKRPFTAFSNPPTLSLFWQDNAKGLVTSSTASLPMSSWPPSIRIVSTGKHDEAPDVVLSDAGPANVWIVRAGSCDAATSGSTSPAFASAGGRPLRSSRDNAVFGARQRAAQRTTTEFRNAGEVGAIPPITFLSKLLAVDDLVAAGTTNRALARYLVINKLQPHVAQCDALINRG
ncbi:hypothetical protein LJR221_001227 [Agrobacterium tumefaciens]